MFIILKRFLLIFLTVQTWQNLSFQFYQRGGGGGGKHKVVTSEITELIK